MVGIKVLRGRRVGIEGSEGCEGGGWWERWRERGKGTENLLARDF